ncbi:MAG: glycosyltransferase family 4 protein [Candidatus Hadarchaeum sp.]|uniref:glycosyltransferase family 4 protein n=1 Tax=Candidatus Hadarchaeum sp. TaxID=2883567 RepID=UPI0031705507
MNICMLLAFHDFPPDIRVEIEARALSRAGHKVMIVCDWDKPKARPLDDYWEGCKVKRIPTLKSGLLRKVNSLVWKVTFRHWYWYYVISRMVPEEKIDVIHVHDLPMVGTGLLVASRYGIPLVADLHENYPAAIAYYKPARLSWHQRILNFLDSTPRWQAYERKCALAATKVLVVVEEAKIRLVEAGIPPEKIEVVENTVDVDYFLSLPLADSIIEKYRGEFVISYIGGFGGRHRGLDTAIEAMPVILREIPNARLLLVGDGPIKPLLEKMVAERSLNERVTFVDWQPFDKIPSFIYASTVCLIPHHSNPHTEATSPHKLFQYMLMGKPVVVSTCKPLRRIVEETGSGLIFQAGNSESLAEAVIKLRDKNLRDQLGEAGRRAVLEKYNWAETSKKLIKVYEQLEQS